MAGPTTEQPPAQGNSADLHAALSHATTWFTYHAGQRMQSFNFFIVFQAGLAFAELQNWTKAAQCGAISAVGLVLAVAFYALEVRNTTLVNDGREALLALQNTISSGNQDLMAMKNAFPLDNDMARTRNWRRWRPVPGDLKDLLPETRRGGNASFSDEAIKRPVFATHTFVFRLLMVLAAGTWVAFLVRSLIIR